MNDFLNELYRTLLSRKGADAHTSYTASLYAKGTAKIAQKVGEEAVETVIEAMKGDKEKIISESADLLFHLLVLWADRGVTPNDVVNVLKSREGKSGIEEKNSRPS